MRDLEDDLAELLALFQIAVGVGGLLERKDAVDDRFEPAARQQGHHGLHVTQGGAVGADDLKLLVEDVVDLDFALVGSRAADRHQAAAARQRADRLVEDFAADVLDDHVDAALVGALHDLFLEIDLVVVDDLVGTELARLLQLPICARRGVDVGPVELGDLNSRHADAGARRIDQDGLPGAQFGALDQHVPRRAEGVGKGRGLLETQVVGQGEEVQGGVLDVLGVGAGKVGAEIPVIAGAAVVMAGHALLAIAARDNPP